MADFSDPALTANMDQALADCGPRVEMIAETYRQVRAAEGETVAFAVVGAALSVSSDIAVYAVAVTALIKYAQATDPTPRPE